MLDTLVVISPVFILVGAGATACWTGVISQATVDGTMSFVLKIAVPVLLFRELARLDLALVFQPALLLSFYLAAFTAYTIGIVVARFVIGRDLPDAVVIGFGALFSNSLLLGIPITFQSFGPESVAGNYAIIAFHSPLTYLVGLTVMEMVLAGRSGMRSLPRKVGGAMFRNAIMVGIAAGILANLLSLAPTGPVGAATEMLAATAFPAALFSLGGVLTRIPIKRSFGAAAMVASLSLLVHPAIAFLLGVGVFGLDKAGVVSAVMTAAMPTGVNGFIFAQLYGRATGAAASAVFLATLLSVLTIPLWIMLLNTVLG